MIPFSAMTPASSPVHSVRSKDFPPSTLRLPTVNENDQVPQWVEDDPCLRKVVFTEDACKGLERCIGENARKKKSKFYDDIESFKAAVTEVRFDDGRAGRKRNEALAGLSLCHYRYTVLLPLSQFDGDLSPSTWMGCIFTFIFYVTPAFPPFFNHHFLHAMLDSTD